MAFTLEGFEVYTTEYDDRGIDFVIRNNEGTCFSVQVKATSASASPFMFADKFEVPSEFLLCAVRLVEGVEFVTAPACRGCHGANKKDDTTIRNILISTRETEQHPAVIGGLAGKRDRSFIRITKTEKGAPPNCGPTTLLGNLGVSEGPPSAS